MEATDQIEANEKTVVRIRKLYFDDYKKATYKESSRLDKIKHNLKEKKWARNTIYYSLVIPYSIFAPFSTAGQIAVGLFGFFATVAFINTACDKISDPVNLRAQESFNRDLPELLNRYETDIEKNLDLVNEKLEKSGIASIYSQTHEAVRIQRLRDAFTDASKTQESENALPAATKTPDIKP